MISSGSRLGRAWRLLLREIERGSLGWQSTEYVAAMDLTAYIDESGIHSGASYCALAGFVASPRQWRLFDLAWKKVLSSTPDLPVFHAGDFFGRSGGFRTLSNEAREAIRQGLCDAITGHRLSPFGIIVDCKVFNGLPEAARRYITGGTMLLEQTSGRWKWDSSGAPNRPYFAGLGTALMLAADLAKPGKTVDFVFDQQESYGPLVLTEFCKTKSLALVDGSEKLGNCIFMDKREVSALQAADLLVHCWCVCHSAMVAGEDEFNKRGPLSRHAATERGMTLFDITKGGWWHDFHFQEFDQEDDLILPIRRLPEEIAQHLLGSKETSEPD